jgi:hypothetical protein
VNKKIFCAAVLLTCPLAHAEIAIEYMNAPFDEVGNIVFDGLGTRSDHPPIGRVHDTNFLFGFESVGSTLIGLSDGQVRVEATDRTFTDISFSSVEHAFSSVAFTLRANTDGQQAAVGQVFITFDLVGEPDYAPAALALNRDSDNFFFIHSPSQFIEGLTISTTLQIRDLRQLTVMGIDQLPQEGGSGEVPEPATGALVGLAAATFALASAGRKRNLRRSKP